MQNNEDRREKYLQIIADTKKWGIEQGLIHLGEMFSQLTGSEKVWFVVHSKDDLGAGFFLHYHGADEQAAHTNRSQLQLFDLETYLFSTDGVSDPEAGILDSHFNLSLVVLVYTILHEGIHRLLEECFFTEQENKGGYSERLTVSQIDEGLAVYLGLKLTRMFVGQFFPDHLRLCDQYIDVTYAFFVSIKEWIQIRMERGDESSVRKKIQRIEAERKHLEYEENAPIESLVFNGAFLALMRRYCWLVEDLKIWFENNELTPQDFINNPPIFRSQLFAIARQNR